MNAVFWFNKYNFFHFWLLASAPKISFCLKNNGFAQLWGLQLPQPAGLYAYVVVLFLNSFLCLK